MTDKPNGFHNMNNDGALAEFIGAWCGLSPNDRVVIVTDDVQEKLARELSAAWQYNCEIQLFSGEAGYAMPLDLCEGDLLIVLLTAKSFMNGANRFFSPFSKPRGLRAKYAFIRLDISRRSLLEGLSTDRSLVQRKIAEMSAYVGDATLHVGNDAGTDILLSVKPFTTCRHEITEAGGMAFLPPSETSAEVIAGAANGRIAVDCTVGQLYRYGELLGEFGLVPSTVYVDVKDGMVTDIYGCHMADELKQKLFALPEECRELVELGQGLSKMNPTGLIGVDESIIDTCHFGIGDGGKCGLHLDIVIKKPCIRRADG